jgi:hypothetical protein
MRSNVWQLMQSATRRFSVSVPGQLASHSALVICATRFRVFLSLMSAVAVCSAAMVAAGLPSRSYPVARIVNV